MKPLKKNLPPWAPGFGVSHRTIIYPEHILSLREIDLHFGRLMQEISGGKEEVFLASSLVSRATEEGHVCLDLSEVAGKEYLFVVRNSERYELIRCPDLKVWCNRLYESKVVGRPGEYRPLILDDNCRLYLYRYWKYENILIQELLKRASRKKNLLNVSFLRELLLKLFSYKEGIIDLQMLSAIIPLTRYICVITGGPGTGKTTTVAKILSLLLAFYQKRMRILLCAPTGKASAKLRQAIVKIRDRLNIEDHIKDKIPTETFTIHRMLRPIPKTPYFRHNSENKLSADVIVVDEASMVDLPLMSKLIQALPEDAALIILGDKDQLSSVEPGSVMGDICAGCTGFPDGVVRLFHKIMGDDVYTLGDEIKRPPINECIVELKKVYRFSETSGIARLSEAVNKGDAEKIFEILKGESYSDIRFRKLPKPDLFRIWLKNKVIDKYGLYLKEKSPLDAIKAFESFRILCPIRWGPYGVKEVNRLVERILQEQGLIPKVNGPWYPGRPLLIVENSYELDLFNGDVGIIMPDPDSKGELRAFFLDQDGNLRKFLPIRLPAHETVFAMTVHKSQGSEFDDLLFILPDVYVPVITRELIYTAITRAKNSIEIWADMEVMEKGITQQIRRSSGLRDALWNQ